MVDMKNFLRENDAIMIKSVIKLFILKNNERGGK
jgi:hypothetical protein